MTDALAVVLGALVGSGLTGLGVTISNILQRRADERRQIRELAVKVALEYHTHQVEAGKLMASSGGTNVTIPPLDLYLIHAMSLIKALDGSIRTPEQVTALLRDSNALGDAAKKEIKARSQR